MPQKLFLSFASEQRDVAENIALALRNRGLHVFFSHDDLPPGTSYDDRIEQSIEASDFFVFLVSPQSVTKGRYTLTELGFARDKWPNPSGRVLPVMIAPTPLEDLPPYLRAVTLLEPEGNVAAETSATVSRMLRRQASGVPGGMRSALFFMGFVLGSAILSYLAWTFAPTVLRFSFVLKGGEIDPPGPTTMLPGLVFGVAVAAVNFVFGLRDRFLLGLLVVVTAIGWIAAFDAAATSAKVLNQYTKPLKPKPTVEPAQGEAPTDGPPQDEPIAVAPGGQWIPGMGYFVGVVGGAVGGGITLLGVLIANARMRRIEPAILAWGKTALAGAVLGLLIPFQGLGMFWLFLVWQAVFVFALCRLQALTAREAL